MKLTLNQIKERLEICGFGLTEAQFNAMTPDQLKSVLRRAEKVRRLTNDIWADVEACAMDDMERE